MKINTTSEQETRALARQISLHLPPGTVVSLVGEIGAGKTHFVKGLAEGLGFAADDVQSPTFTLLHVYEGDRVLNHFDVYRIEHLDDMDELGYEEFFFGDDITVVEWGDLIEPLLPDNVLEVRLEKTGEFTRTIRFRADTPEFEPLRTALKTIENR